MVRQATGPNEQPTAPTFLKVYKLLSISSVLKPPKTGNCQILYSVDNRISVAHIVLFADLIILISYDQY